MRTEFDLNAEGQDDFKKNLPSTDKIDWFKEAQPNWEEITSPPLCIEQTLCYKLAAHTVFIGHKRFRAACIQRANVCDRFCLHTEA